MLCKFNHLKNKFKNIFVKIYIYFSTYIYFRKNITYSKKIKILYNKNKKFNPHLKLKI